MKRISTFLIIAVVIMISQSCTAKYPTVSHVDTVDYVQKMRRYHDSISEKMSRRREDLLQTDDLK